MKLAVFSLLLSGATCCGQPDPHSPTKFFQVVSSGNVIACVPGDKIMAHARGGGLLSGGVSSNCLSVITYQYEGNYYRYDKSVTVCDGTILEVETC